MKRAILFASLFLATPAFAQQYDGATALTDRSIASLSGSSQTLFIDVGSRGIRERYVCNPSGANAIALNLSGGTAVLNSGGSVTLSSGGCWSGRVSNQINVIGTAGQGVTAGER